MAAFVVLVWFGSEAFTAQNICATTCISLGGMNYVEDGIVVAILPVLLFIGGLRVRNNEKRQVMEAKTEQDKSGQK